MIENKIIRPEYETLIFIIRGKKVMVDSDLALLYNIPTKALKQQVRRNVLRFPEDFMFELTNPEKKELVTNCDRLSHLRHSSVNPFVFTEQGVAMLSSVLRSEEAIRINIEIMRAFVRYRSLLKETGELRHTIQEIERKFTDAFLYLMERLDQIQRKESEPRRKVGFQFPKKTSPDE
ncbi:MAG: ORF6N domain-containing protein [Bacteroidetes bacterium]|nr:ORF6N domain-containing protein [Bacteroidota bacterium]